ncbi:unnamed protein product [Strongylus vulgaris]|uniref:Uncharacterized protein n=1 Tax=Strongylus vulgaris TaxID=40348 RepID=A0A3P7K421_STRVU|nr:unnamed protein product [Strongylus vulgaris]
MMQSYWSRLQRYCAILSLKAIGISFSSWTTHQIKENCLVNGCGVSPIASCNGAECTTGWIKDEYGPDDPLKSLPRNDEDAETL